MQQINLFKAENVDLKFDDDSIKTMAQYAFDMNQNTQNIGVRRLHAIVQKVLEDLSFDASENKGQNITITSQYVKKRLEGMSTKINLAKYLI